MIDHTIKTLSSGGKMTFNIPQRIYNVYGRSLGIEGGDGSRSTVGVFDYRTACTRSKPKHFQVGGARLTF